MKKISFLLVLVLLTVVCFSQDSLRPRRMTLKMTITDSIRRVERGYLATIRDSEIVMLKTPILFDQPLMSARVNSIPFQNISDVTIHRKGNVVKGILIGALGGAVTGGIIGRVSYRPLDCRSFLFCYDLGPGVSTTGGAILGSVGGAILGGIIGAAAKRKFIIGGRKPKFDEMKNNVFQMIYRNNKH